MALYGVMGQRTLISVAYEHKNKSTKHRSVFGACLVLVKRPKVSIEQIKTAHEINS